MSEIKKAGRVRTWVGAGMFLVGSMTTIYHANRSLSVDARVDDLELARDNFFDLAQDNSISDAVYDHIEATSSETNARLVGYRAYVPSESADDLVAGCKAELNKINPPRPQQKCDQLGEALIDYRDASTEFTEAVDEIATARNLAEVVGGGALVLTGIGVGLSGLAASKKQG